MFMFYIETLYKVFFPDYGLAILSVFAQKLVELNRCAATCDFQQRGILSEDSDEPVQPPAKLRNSKSCLLISLTVIEY